MAAIGAMGTEMALDQILGPEASPSRGRRRPRFRTWRLVVMLIAGAYFLAPIYAGLKFALQNDANHFSFFAVKALPTEPGFGAAFWLSMRLSLVTVVLSMVLMVPTTIYVHLRLPKVRRVVEFITILPIALAGFLALISPTYFDPMITDPLGHIMLGMAIFSIAVGAVAIQKIVKIEV